MQQWAGQLQQYIYIYLPFSPFGEKWLAAAPPHSKLEIYSDGSGTITNLLEMLSRRWNDGLVIHANIMCFCCYWHLETDGVRQPQLTASWKFILNDVVQSEIYWKCFHVDTMMGWSAVTIYILFF